MKKTYDDPYKDEVTPLVEGLGYNLLELVSARRKGTLHIQAILHRPEGVGLDECAEVHKTLMPRLEVVADTRDIRLEVSSPGLSRSIKSGEEFAHFCGKGVRVLDDDADDWVGGIIEACDEESVTIRNGSEMHRFAFATIRKAKLDESQEEV
mgnify:CR=1 FL=1